MSILETDRLYLKPISEKDAEFYLALMNTPKWFEYIGDRKIYTVEAAIPYIEERMGRQWEIHGYGNYILWTKEEPSKPLGACGLFVRAGLEGCDLGFALMPYAEKLGYGYEASQCVLKHAFQTLNLPFLNAITSENNLDCQKLLSKLGFSYVGEFEVPGEGGSVRKYLLQAQDYAVNNRAK